MSITVCGQPATDVSQLQPQAATGELTYHTCLWWGKKKESLQRRRKPTQTQGKHANYTQKHPARAGNETRCEETAAKLAVSPTSFLAFQKMFTFSVNTKTVCQDEKEKKDVFEPCLHWSLPFFFHGMILVSVLIPRLPSSGYVRAQVLS